MTTKTATLAQQIADRAREAGYRARPWNADYRPESRVYIARRLAHYWQEIGYVEITDDDVVPHLTRGRAGVMRDLGLN